MPKLEPELRKLSLTELTEECLVLATAMRSVLFNSNTSEIAIALGMTVGTYMVACETSVDAALFIDAVRSVAAVTYKAMQAKDA